METTVAQLSPDIWSSWLLNQRHGGDPQYEESVQEMVQTYADRVLKAAQLKEGMTIADIGCGDGLIAFRAIEEVGTTLKVILTDISAPLLSHAKDRAAQRGVMDQCRFIECSAENLQEIEDSTVDVVTARAVLAYVADKRAALKDFFRILKPGARLSIAEPIFQDESFSAMALRARAQSHTSHPYIKLLHRWKAAQFPDTQEAFAANPLVNFSERDLVVMVNGAGFSQVHMEFHIDVRPSDVTSWDVFLEISPHPWAPPLSVILGEQFTPEERVLFEKTLRPSVESGELNITDRSVYLSGSKHL